MATDYVPDRLYRDYHWKEQVHLRLYGSPKKPKTWEEHTGANDRVSRLMATGFFGKNN